MKKFSSINYLCKSGFKNVWSNGVMSFATAIILVFCLLLSGVAILISENVDNILSKIESNNNVKVFLDESVSTLDAIQIGEKIKQISNVNECEFVSKEEAAQKIIDNIKKKSQSSDYLAKSYAQNNDLPHSFNVNLVDLSLYDETISQISKVEGVSIINDTSEIANKLTTFSRRTSTIFTAIIIILCIVSLFIMITTIKITMYNRRLEIRIMKSVGATDWFIRIPFIVEGIVISLFGAVIALLTLIILMPLFLQQFSKLFAFQNFEFISVSWQMVLGFILAGFLFGVIGGAISIRKYLKKEGGEIIEG